VKKKYLTRVIRLATPFAIGVGSIPFLVVPATAQQVGSASLSSGSAEVRSSVPVPSNEIKAAHPWRIAFVPKFKFLGETGALSSYWQPAWEGAQKAGADFNVTVRLVTSNILGSSDPDYVEPQIRLIADLIAKGVTDGLVVAPFDSNRLAPVLEKAVQAGISVVSMDTPVNSDRLLTAVAFDNFKAGRDLGAWVVRRLRAKGNALILDGPQHQQNAVDRRNGFLAGLDTGNIKVLNIKSADWEVGTARSITENWLEIYPDVEVIMAANDNMAIGAAQAVAAAHRYGILITGFDATDAALEAVRTGQIAATVDQTPDQQARLAIQILVRHLETGENFAPVVYLQGASLVTAENVGSYLSHKELKK
jgi:ribose transport system substrate-binding protein